MCSPAPVVLHSLDHPGVQGVPESSRPDAAAKQSNTLRKKLQNWLAAWKQTLIAELASLGSPKEGFL